MAFNILNKQHLKILLIHDTHGEYGGAETHFNDVCELLKNHGIKIYTFTFSTETDNRMISNYVYKESKNWLIRKIFKFTFNPKLYFIIKYLLKKIDPSIVHLHMNTKYPLTVLLALRKRKIIHTLHGPSLICPSGWCVTKDDLEVCKGGIGIKCVKHKCIPLRYLLLHYILFKLNIFYCKKFIDIIISPSHWLASYVKNFGFHNVEHIYYFLNLDKFKPKDYPKESKTILFAGLLDFKKGIHNLIKAMPLVLTKIPDAKLLILGDGPERQKLIKLSKHLAIEQHVEFLGSIAHKLVSFYYAKANVCAVPSLWNENSPLVVYEAMANARPVVGSQKGGIPELVKDGERGYIVDANNPNEIAEKIITLLNNSHLAEQMGKNGRKFVEENLNPELFLIKLCQQYNRLL